MPAKPTAKFYAVAAGRATGVFRSWDECRRSVNGFSGASFKAFTFMLTFPPPGQS